LDQLLKIGEEEATILREASIPDIESSSITNTTQISDLLENCIQGLKTIKRQKISNTELLDGVDCVSRNIEGYINLAESTLQHYSTKIPQVPKQPSPRLDQTGNIFSKTDRVNASLASCIKLAEDTLHA